MFFLLLGVALHTFLYGVDPIATELLTPYKCAWLEIPHTPYSVLISLNSNEAAPWVKTLTKEENHKQVVQIKTNFSFVDPSHYDNQTRQYKKLPEGLFHWKDDASFTAGQEIKRLGNKANTTVGENNYLARPFPKRLSGFALNKSGNEYTNLLADGTSWNNCLLKHESFNVLKRLLADIRLPKWDPETFEFNVATNNALFNGGSKGSTYRGALSAEKREKFFNQLFNDEATLVDCDLICLQEASKLSTVSLEKNGYELIYDTKEIGLLTAVNPNKFEVIENETTLFSTKETSNRGFLMTIIETKELEANKRVGIINTHVSRTNASKNVTPLFVQQQQLQQIVKAIKQKSGVSHWILCGDLNLNGFDTTIYQMISEILTEANITLNSNTSNKPSAVSATKDGDRTYKQVDYIIVSPTFMVSACSHYPTDAEQLLDQTTQDTQLHYHSDHAIIKTTLSFTDDDVN
jgi:endonuclease/exonuclease/phosphatase family metal-dependent hydrolase